MSRSRWLVLAFIPLLVLAACSPGREYELRGQVLAVSPERREITVRHEDIRGFMPGMTMPFKVQDPGLLEGRVPGDLIRARLVVREQGAYLAAIERVGHEEFVDERGAARRLSDWRGRAVALTFVYTRCPLPDFCPRMDRQFAAVQRDVLADERLRERVKLLSVSFDPDFDTPEVLARHAGAVRADPAVWSFVTGEREEIDAFAAQFGVSILRDQAGESGPREILHNLRTVVIDPHGRVAAVLNGNDWLPGELFEELRRAGGR